MSDQDMESRIRFLEQEYARDDERIKTLQELQGETVQTLAETNKELGRVVTCLELVLQAQKDAHERACPAPGACLDLRKDVDAMKLAQAEQRGGWAAIGVVVGSVSGAASLLIWLGQWLWPHEPK